MPFDSRLDSVSNFDNAFDGSARFASSDFRLNALSQKGASNTISFEVAERVATFAFSAHALSCCPCGQDHSGDLLAHKTSLTSVPVDTAVRLVSEGTQYAVDGGPERATVTVSGDVPGNDSTTQVLAIGDTILSQIETVGDQDWFVVQLVAGVTYEFTLTGTGGSPLIDPFLELMDPAGNKIVDNDDGGSGLNSLLRYTPTGSGTYYLNAHHFGSGVPTDPLTGSYALTAIEAPPLPTFTITEIANYLVNDGSSSGRSWGPDSITYNIEALTQPQQVLAERALQAWAAVTPIVFTRVTSGGNITFTNVDPTPEGPAAYAQNTFQGNNITASTIVITSDWQSGNTAFDSYTQQTYIHEVGHALGLGHAGPYNGTATYGTDNIYTNDSWSTTVMSYFDQLEAGLGSRRFV